MNKPDTMAYFEGMEESDPAIMNRVLAETAAYDPGRYSTADAVRALEAAKSSGSRGCSVEEFGILLSPAAAPFLEDMAFLARAETRKRFGNAVQLFTPLYISNYCENACVYCGFNCRNAIRRARLDRDGIEREMKAIAATGLEEILILTGESPAKSGVEYIGGACSLARDYFRVVGLEVYPMDSAAYAYLHQQGADYVTVFQETYDTHLYGALHPVGRKRSFPYRFNAQERAFKGGVRGAAFASLLGLGDFRRDCFAAGLHAFLIQKKFPYGEISFSCPRLRPTAADSTINPRDVGEPELLQAICAYRLFMPHAGITVSTRENARFRDHAVEIAATRISAGVDVGIGGRLGGARGGEQFEISDTRTAEEICRMLFSRGLQPVMSDSIYV
jgi:2-iminoacetate synthase